MFRKLIVLAILGIGVAHAQSGGEIIVDNRDAATTTSGTWRVSAAKGFYGEDSVYSLPNAVFTWIPSLPEAGDYDVFVRWTYYSTRGTDVPYTLFHAGADSPFMITVDQQDRAAAGDWFPVGRFTFDAGSNRISVSGENGQASADAVRFVYAGEVVPAHWPKVTCPCDEYFSRAVDKFTGLGGTLRANRCESDCGSTGCFALAQYSHKTDASVDDTISLRLSASESFDPGTGALPPEFIVGNRCVAYFDGTSRGDFNPYSRIIGKGSGIGEDISASGGHPSEREISLTEDEVRACIRSVTDRCGNDRQDLVGPTDP